MKKIQEEKWYNLQELEDANAFSWCRGHRCYVATIEKDLKKGNLLNGMIKGKSRSRRYLFKGRNIINLVRMVESSEYKIF